MKPSEYLDKCKIALSIQSNYALANTLKINTGTLTHYYEGKRWPDAYACARIAVTLKLDPLEVLADIESQHAKTEERAEFWRGFIGRSKKAGARLLWALIFGIFLGQGVALEAARMVQAANAALNLLKLRTSYNGRLWRTATD